MKNSNWILTESVYLMDRHIEYPLDAQQTTNMAVLVLRVNSLLADVPEAARPRGITSGYRPGRFNVAAGGAPKSAHLTCQAVDLADPKNELDKYLDAHPELLELHDLWRETPKATPGWCHIQSREVKGNKRTFNI